MDRLNLINHILDTCLTTDTLDLVYPPNKALEEALLSEDQLMDRHKSVRLDLLEMVGKIIQKGTGEAVQGEECVSLVFRRVDLFLIHRGFHIK